MKRSVVSPWCWGLIGMQWGINYADDSVIPDPFWLRINWGITAVVMVWLAIVAWRVRWDAKVRDAERRLGGYIAVCEACGGWIGPGDEVWYDNKAVVAWHVHCLAAPTFWQRGGPRTIELIRL
jgi:hypothetical protein